MNTDVVVIGSGPAGISAAIYALRAGNNVVIVSKDAGALGKTDKIQNYYGFPDVISGSELHQNGIEQAKNLGGICIQDEILSISYDGSYTISGKSGVYHAKTVLLATGAEKAAPKINGLKEFEGSGVSYCAVCDAFFYRKKKVAVLGSSEYALNEAMELQNVASEVYVLTNGEEPKAEFPDNFKVKKEKISKLNGEIKLSEVVFEDGEVLTIDGLFVAIATASTSALARKLGALIENGKIAVDEKMQTTVPGLFAAGDCTGGLLQISKAVYEGAKAGISISEYLRKMKK